MTLTYILIGWAVCTAIAIGIANNEQAKADEMYESNQRVERIKRLREVAQHHFNGFMQSTSEIEDCHHGEQFDMCMEELRSMLTDAEYEAVQSGLCREYEREMS